MTSAVRRAAPRLASKVARARSPQFAPGQIGSEKSMQAIGELELVRDLDNRLLVDEFAGDDFEILHIRPNDDRRTESCGFNEILAALATQTFPDESERDAL